MNPAPFAYIPFPFDMKRFILCGDSADMYPSISLLFEPFTLNTTVLASCPGTRFVFGGTIPERCPRPTPVLLSISSPLLSTLNSLKVFTEVPCLPGVDMFITGTPFGAVFIFAFCCVFGSSSMPAPKPVKDIAHSTIIASSLFISLLSSLFSFIPLSPSFLIFFFLSCLTFKPYSLFSPKSCT